MKEAILLISETMIRDWVLHDYFPVREETVAVKFAVIKDVGTIPISASSYNTYEEYLKQWSKPGMAD